MKRLLVSLLILFSVIVPMAFASGAREEEKPEKLVYISPAWGTPSQELLDKFQSQSGIKVEVTTLDVNALRDKVVTAAAAKISPADVIFARINDFGAFAASGVLMELDKSISSETFGRVYGKQFFQMDGKTYAVPLYQQLVMIDYDKAALAKIGLKREDLKTWKDFEDACAKLKAQGINEYPFSFGVRSWSWYIMALSSGSKLFNDKMEPVFDQPADPGYKAFGMLIDFYKKGFISPERITSPNPHPAFWAGQATFHQAWQGSLAMANNTEKSKIAPNADYILMPEKHFTWNLPAGLSISAYTKYPKACQEFINFMISEAAQRYIYETNGMFPAQNELFAKLGAEGKIEGYDVMAEQFKYVIPLPYNTPWFAEFDTEATNALVRVARGDQAVDAAIKALADFQRKLKKEYE